MVERLIKRRESSLQGLWKSREITVESKREKKLWHSLLCFLNAESGPNQEGRGPLCIHVLEQLALPSNLLRLSKISYFKKEGRWDQAPKLCLPDLIHVNFPKDELPTFYFLGTIIPSLCWTSSVKNIWFNFLLPLSPGSKSWLWEIILEEFIYYCTL